MFMKDTKEVRSLRKVIEGDPLTQLDEQDKELIWKARSAGRTSSSAHTGFQQLSLATSCLT